MAHYSEGGAVHTAAAASFLWRAPLLAVFLVSGASVFFDASTRDAHAALYAAGLARLGLPAAQAAAAGAPLAYAMAGLALSGAAAALQAGGERCGSAMLAVFVLVSTPALHWPLSAAGKLDVPEAVHCLKDLSMLGALYLVWLVGCDYVRIKKEAATRSGFKKE